MVVTPWACRGFLLLLLVFLPSSLFAQAGNQAPIAQRAILLHVDQLPGAGYSENELFMISRSMLLALQAASAGLTFVESPESAPPASDDRLTGTAKKAGADSWLWIEITVKGAETSLRVRSFDIFFQQSAFDRTLSREGRLLALDLPFEKWDDIVSLVLDKFRGADLAAADGPGPQTAVITIRALPGTRVTAPKGPEVRTGRDGYAEMTLASPAEYSLRAVLPGYRTETQRFFLASNRTIDFQQKAAPLWAVEASLKDLGYPSFDVTRFIVPNVSWLRLGITSYVVGLALVSQSSDQSGNSGAVFTSNPLTNLVFQGGMYFNPDFKLFRYYWELGFFARIIHPPGSFPYIDPLSQGGFLITVGTEIAHTPVAKFFFEYTPMIYAVSVPNLFQASLAAGDPPPGWIFSSGAAISLLSFRIGYRWLL
jgi:hypothetical protein